MSKEQIIIEVDEDGSTTIEVKGVQGKGCTKLTAEIEKSLGVVTERRLTKDYHKASRKVRNIQKLGG